MRNQTGGKALADGVDSNAATLLQPLKWIMKWITSAYIEGMAMSAQESAPGQASSREYFVGHVCAVMTSSLPGSGHVLARWQTIRR